MHRINNVAGHLTKGPKDRTIVIPEGCCGVPNLCDAAPGCENTITSFYYGKVQLYFGPGAINKLDEIIKTFKVKTLGIVTDRVGYKACGAWPHVLRIMKANGVNYVHFDQIKANPYVDDVENCVKKFEPFNVTHVLGIGGGSAIDAAKAVAVLLKNAGMSCKNLYDQKYNHLELEAIPVIAINTTHGTGTEVDRFSVVTVKDKKTGECFKPAIAFKSIYPVASINDPNLLVSLPLKQSIYTAVDALNHVMEAVSTQSRSPFGISLGRQVYEIVGKFLPLAVKEPKNPKYRYWLLFAASMAGFTFDAAGLHLTHALEHPMSALKHDVIHGLGLAVIQPAVLKAVYPVCSKELAYVMNPIFTTKLRGTPDEAHSAAVQLEEFLVKVGIPEKLSDIGFPTVADCEKLTDNMYKTEFLKNLAPNAPIPVSRELVFKIYKDSLKPLRLQKH